MAEKQRILIVDDDEHIAELISLYLIKECYETKIAHDGETALSEFKTFHPHMIILDLMLPGIDGYEVCRRIRKESNTPIMMLSAKGEVFDKVLGLELGADDYMMKPFDSKEMVARVHAILRRAAAGQTAIADSAEVISYEGISVNISDYTVIYKNEKVEMPPKELELLYFLMKNPNRVFTREQLLEHIWGYDFAGDTRTVDVHIKRIREKIQDYGNWSIGTVYSVGYKFGVLG